ncbi:homocysteine S-methyltransferase family protein [Coriobacteriia bacterium Es71-Z0120]|uniref:homocysteine S-methyltransferase family protein n=1 Tax=Parvivirga hydrogeniphila TaxID=2939460 RepID=UPI00226092DD|nr:homocysteine S-methyltransferase family protein [Parvivirga hydrogeniphila]MCL4078629.1 homocysteine S-methyltransferase family protein [Parvivirga hydrogeniphila]
MPDVAARLGREVLVVDGAMGTMLQRAGIPTEQPGIQLNLIAPDVIAEIHRSYVLVGADCVTTNTFGGTRPKLAQHGLEDMLDDLNRAGVRLARESGAQHVLADVGPTGLVMEPLGAATFDEVYAHFFEQVQALAVESPDAILIETMTDIAEARCAVLAARDACDLPVFVTVTFGRSGVMDLSGTPPETAAVILEAAGAAAVGINCGLGPAEMLPLVERMARATALPIIIQPNAGIPRIVDGATVFPGTADEMGSYAAKFVEAGASVVGSCCGSTPAFTGAIVDAAKHLPVRARSGRGPGVTLASPRRTVTIGGGRRIVAIGERINPTGKKALAESLKEGSMAIVRQFAAEQAAAGADALDVNVGAAGVDAKQALPAAVLALSGSCDLPLVLDTTDADALEEALKLYPGRALINSVNGGEASMSAVLPLARRYGAAVLVLALDDDGIPATAEGRVAVVERVRGCAHDAGLADDDLLVDCLVLTAASDPGSAAVTLEALRQVKSRWGLAAVLGVSNVSHGLPGRSTLNAAFLAMAAGAGLDAAIVNPADAEVMRTVAAVDALLGRDERAQRWVALAAERAPEAAPESARDEDLLALAIERGDADGAPGLVKRLIARGVRPQDVIASVLTPAIQRLGDAYGRGDVFLPQLIAAADAMKAAVEVAKRHLPPGEGVSLGRVAFGTVKGDIHSIGKDICISMLESYGFSVDDLGVDVSAERFAEAALDADVVCASALMTTTLSAMEEAVRAVASTGTPVLVGGAVVTADYARSIGAGYAEDAPGCVEAVRAALAKRRGEEGI